MLVNSGSVMMDNDLLCKFVEIGKSSDKVQTKSSLEMHSTVDSSEAQIESLLEVRSIDSSSEYRT